MTPFQIVALTLIAILLVATVVSTFRGIATRREGVLWSSVWLAAGIAIAQPRIIAVVARALGIGRGADLLLYCAVVVMLIGFLMVYTRLRRLRRDMTLITRHLAIQNAIDNRQPTRRSTRNRVVSL